MKPADGSQWWHTHQKKILGIITTLVTIMTFIQQLGQFVQWLQNLVK